MGHAALGAFPTLIGGFDDDVLGDLLVLVSRIERSRRSWLPMAVCWAPVARASRPLWEQLKGACVYSAAIFAVANTGSVQRLHTGIVPIGSCGSRILSSI